MDTIIEERLAALASALRAVKERARELAAAARARDDREFKRCFIGEIEVYLVPFVESLVDDKNQPGSVASLVAMLDDKEEK